MSWPRRARQTRARGECGAAPRDRRWGASGDGRGSEVEWGRWMAAWCGEATTDEVEWGVIFLDRERDGGDLEMSGSKYYGFFLFVCFVWSMQ